MTQIITQPIKSIECRFAVHIPAPEPSMSDYHLVKEHIVYEDGTSGPNVKLIEDYKRPFWVTRKGFQNHKDKKEWELEERLIKGMSTQDRLQTNCAKALGKAWFNGDLRKLSSSPYLYGSDILSTSVIKKEYQDNYPVNPSKFSVAVIDTETDVLYDTGEIIMMTITYKETVLTAVVSSFLKGHINVQDKVVNLMTKYLGEYETKRKLKSELVIVETALDAVKVCLARAHELKPDFLAVWNIDFDMTKILEACEKENVDPAEIFSDPSVPKDYRFFKYKRGPKQKVTASGKVTPILSHAQWHTVFTPASFYVIDAMCVFKQNRTGQPERQSYALDSILDSILGVRKLKFEEAKNHIKLAWHRFMQSNYPLEYIIYNRFDCISIEELDEKTLDLSLTMPMFAGISDFSKYNSQPRRSVDRLHYFCLDRKMVIGSTSSDMRVDFDDETISLNDFIVTLPAHLIVDNGMKVIEEFPDLRTNIRIHQGDLDVSAAYPNNQCVANVSKATTVREITNIEGVDTFTQKMQGINLSAGNINAVEWCSTMYNFPTMKIMLSMFENEIK
jgi:hypothetical protein